MIAEGSSARLVVQSFMFVRPSDDLVSPSSSASNESIAAPSVEGAESSQSSAVDQEEIETADVAAVRDDTVRELERRDPRVVNAMSGRDDGFR